MSKILEKTEEVIFEQLEVIQNSSNISEKETACKIIETVSRILEIQGLLSYEPPTALKHE